MKVNLILFFISQKLNFKKNNNVWAVEINKFVYVTIYLFI